MHVSDEAFSNKKMRRRLSSRHTWSGQNKLLVGQYPRHVELALIHSRFQCSGSQTQTRLPSPTLDRDWSYRSRENGARVHRQVTRDVRVVFESSLQSGAGQARNETVRDARGFGCCGLAAILGVAVRFASDLAAGAASKGRSGCHHGQLKGIDAMAQDHNEAG